MLPGDRRQHHVAKTGLLPGRQAPEGFRRFEQPLDQLFSHLLAPGRDDQHVHPAVGWIGLPDHEAGQLEAIGRIHDG